MIVTFELDDLTIRLEQATQTCFSWRKFPNGTWGAVHSCSLTQALEILRGLKTTMEDGIPETDSRSPRV